MASMCSESPGCSVADDGEMWICSGMQPTCVVGSVTDVFDPPHETTPTEPATAQTANADKALFIHYRLRSTPPRGHVRRPVSMLMTPHSSDGYRPYPRGSKGRGGGTYASGV